MFKQNLTAMKNHFVENKTLILATSTALLGVVVVGQNAGLRQHDAFLVEKGLKDEYYLPED